MKQIKKRILDRSESGFLGDEGTGLKKLNRNKSNKINKLSPA